MWRERNAARALACIAASWALTAITPSTTQAQPTEHDPSVLAKLRDGRLQEISPSSRGRVDLVAVIQGLRDAECRLDVQSRRSVTDLLQLAMSGIRSEDAPSLVLLRQHPTYARTGVMIMQHGCDGPVVRQVAANLVRWLENPPVEAKASLLREELVHWTQAGFALHQLDPSQRAALERTLGPTQVMRCHYRNVDVANNTFTHSVMRVAWHRGAPEGVAVWATTYGHPLGNMGPLALEACPDSEQAFDAARDAAARRSARAGAGPAGAAPAGGGSAGAGTAGAGSMGAGQTAARPGRDETRQALRCRMAQGQLASVEDHGRRRPEDRTADWASRVEELREAARQKCAGQ